MKSPTKIACGAVVAVGVLAAGVALRHWFVPEIHVPSCEQRLASYRDLKPVAPGVLDHPRTDSDAMGDVIAMGVGSFVIGVDVAECFSKRPEVQACLQSVHQASEVQHCIDLDQRIGQAAK